VSYRLFAMNPTNGIHTTDHDINALCTVYRTNPEV
jgi:hypothetical protein